MAPPQPQSKFQIQHISCYMKCSCGAMFRCCNGTVYDKTIRLMHLANWHAKVYPSRHGGHEKSYFADVPVPSEVANSCTAPTLEEVTKAERKGFVTLPRSLTGICDFINWKE